MGHCAGTDLPCSSRYRTQDCAGVDVLSQNVKRTPTSQRECFRFGLPPTNIWSGAAAASRRMRDKGSGGASGSKAILVFPASPAPLSSLHNFRPFSYWKNPKTAWRDMRLMEVVTPGSEGSGMVEGITEDQYRQLNEFPLSEQTRSLPAFSGRPLL